MADLALLNLHAVPIGKGFPLNLDLWDLHNCFHHHLLSFSIVCTFKQASQSALLNNHEGSDLGEYSWSLKTCCLLYSMMQEVVCDPTIKGSSQSSPEGLTQFFLPCFLPVQGSAGYSFRSCTTFLKSLTSVAKRRLSPPFETFKIK